jgi:plastocyanin
MAAWSRCLYLEHILGDLIMVKRNVFLALILVTAITAGAYAGTLRGKVSSMTKSGVVYVDRIAGKTFPATTVPYQIDQHGQSFEPRVLVIPQGATVVFKNSDTVAHNVRWPAISGDKSLAHNLGTWASGDDRKFRFGRPGVVPLLCNMHAEMVGYIIVVPTPYYAYATPAGDYTVRDIPDGHYSVTVWREGKPAETRQVTVAGNTDFNF